MPRGGRRHRKRISEHLAAGTYRPDRHRGGEAPLLPVARPPRPPRGLDPAKRAAWEEVRAQVIELGTYTAADLSAFKLAVEALYLVYAAPPDLKATSRRSLIASASEMIRRFGMDPASRALVDAAPGPTRDEPEDDPLAEFGHAK